MLSIFLNKCKKYFYFIVKGISMNFEFFDGFYVLVEEIFYVENG